jgi:intracellular sulfur oxidation DsrE/DsrF family protein
MTAFGATKSLSNRIRFDCFAPQCSRSADTFQPRLINYRFLAHAVWSTDDFHLQLIDNDIAGWSAEAQVIAVFHTNAGHVTLNDDAYNAERNIATGNPYKGLVADLMKHGVQIELCGATAKVHNWGNADLLPGRERCSSFEKGSLKLRNNATMSRRDENRQQPVTSSSRFYVPVEAVKVWRGANPRCRSVRVLRGSAENAHCAGL